MRYIGGKSLLNDNIAKAIELNTQNVKSVIDIFSGSGAVASYLKEKGYTLLCNDILYFSFILQRASIGLNRKPTFSHLGIDDPINHLNSLSLEQTSFSKNDCFIYQNYSLGGSERMYFQEKNALKIDIIRMTIEEWHKSNQINDDEYYYLLAALINAVPYVANITGVYAAYLKFWDKRTFNDLTLEELPLFDNNVQNQCFNNDYRELLNIKADLLYADPPYNSREYLPNYHILETIARYDSPEIHGVTGMREYSDLKSPFCKKNSVESAFEALIRDTQCQYILISYNNEALLPTERLSEICKEYAVQDSFKLFEFSYRRYKNKIPNNSQGLKEQLYFLRRN